VTIHSDEQIPGCSNLARVGRGGSSTVYRATQVSLQRDVAIKYLLVDLSAEDDARRFTTECGGGGLVRRNARGYTSAQAQ
jgi:serine/threonine protein kinase